MPAVSVVIPVYNGAAFVEAAITSVYAQTVLPAEVIVVDDGSTDDTPAILRRLEPKLGPTFQWISQPNSGNSSARNAGMRRSSGAFPALLDQDDIWHPKKLERQLAHLDADPGLSLTFTAPGV